MTRKVVKPAWDSRPNPMPKGWNEPIDMSPANLAAAALAEEWSQSPATVAGQSVASDKQAPAASTVQQPSEQPIVQTQAAPASSVPGAEDPVSSGLRDFYVGTDTPNYQYSTDRPATRWEQFTAQLFNRDRATQNLVQGLGESYLARQAAIAGEEKITAEEANKRWPGLEKPFDQPQYPSVAQAIVDRQEALRERESIIASGPHDTVSAITGLVAGLANWSTDSINILMMLAGGVGARLAGVGSLTGGAKLVAVMAENLAVAAPGAAINYYQAQRDQRRVDAGDAIAGELQGAAFGTGLHYLGSFLKGVARESRLKALADVSDGKPVEVGPVHQNAEQRASGAPKTIDPNAEYRFKPLESTTDRPWFASADSAPGGFKESQATIIGPDIGDGRYITDNPYAANTHEVIHEVAAKELELLNIDETPTAAIRDAIEPYLPEGSKAETIKEMLAAVRTEMQHGAVPADALNQINEKIQTMGYDGLRHVQVDASGQNPHNVALVFDPAGTGDASGKLAETGKMSAAPEMNASKSPEELKALAAERASPENSIDHDPDAAQAVAKNLSEPVVTPDAARIREIEAETAELKRAALEEGTLTQDEIDSIDAEHERIDGGAKEEAVKAFKLCEGKSL